MPESTTTGTFVGRGATEPTPSRAPPKRLIRAPLRRLAEVALRGQRTVVAPADSMPAVAPSPPDPSIPPAATTPPAATAATALAPLAAELALLEEAESAMRKGRSGQALARLQEHRRAFPDSALAEEAAVLHIAALFGANQGAAARTEAKRFLTRSSGSLLADRVRSMLAADPDRASTPPKGDHP